MKKKIDFVIDTSDEEKTILRFYPRRSHVHGFGDTPPKEWNKVYKTYLSYSIINQYTWDGGSKHEIMYDESFDECSGLNELVEVLKEILNNPNENTYKVRPDGDGTTWEINVLKGAYLNLIVQFTLVQSYSGKAYRFYLGIDELKSLADTIEYYLEYMLLHSEPI